MNIRSLHLHFDELFTLITNTGAAFEIIGLSETKDTIDSPISTNTDIPRYKFHNAPSQSAAGGVGIYVKSSLKADKGLDLSTFTSDFKTLWIEIQNTKSKNILFCCAYRHPSSDIDKFNEHMQEIITKIENEKKLVFIMGNFNINSLNYENHTPTSDFINTFFANHLQPLILQPTKVTDSTSTLIDNIFSNDISNKVTMGNMLIQISDHFPEFSILRTSALDFSNCSHLVYDYKKFDQSQFLSEYQNMDFGFLDSVEQNVDSKFDEFLGNLSHLVNKHCPKKKLNKKTLRNKPWINSQILQMMRIRDKLFQH